MRLAPWPGSLQELTTELKMEVRAILQQHNVTQFKIRPVQRNYAFENPQVSHGLQWVLKVTYPASFPQLPLGLSGQPSFVTCATSSSCKRYGCLSACPHVSLTPLSTSTQAGCNWCSHLPRRHLSLCHNNVVLVHIPAADSRCHNAISLTSQLLLQVTILWPYLAAIRAG